MEDGYGSITWWGYSPTFNILKSPDSDASSEELTSQASHLTLVDEETVNILLVGSADSRHILSTICKAHTYSSKKVHFYVIESSLELIARHTLLIALALERQDRMGLQEKTELFLEIYGNLLTRHQAADYVVQMANFGIRCITDENFLEDSLPILDFSQLKFKERDFLEAIFKFWRHPEMKHFDAAKCWDLRLRQALKDRYDSRKNVFDWDFSMILAERDAKIIHNVLYYRWREAGIAFQIREGDYEVPNRTLASGLVIKHDGDRHFRRGYWGDITTGPYITYGIESEEQEFFQKYNGILRKTAVDVAEYNVTAMFYELQHGRKYVKPEEKPEQKAAAATMPTVEEIDDTEAAAIEAEAAAGPCDDDDEAVTEKEPELKPLDRPYQSLPVPNVRVHFLSLGALDDLVKKKKYQGLFSHVYFSNSLVHSFKPEVASLLKPNARVCIESARFMLGVRQEQLSMYREKITTMAKEAGCQPLTTSDDKTSILRFRFEGLAES